MTETQTAPDLSHLPREDRVRIAVAVTQGSRWEKLPERPAFAMLWETPGTGAWAFSDADLTPQAWTLSGGRHLWGLDGPVSDPLSDPTAWGALMEKERIEVRPAVSYWEARSPGRIHIEGRTHDRPWEHGEIGPAICAAVLAKYGVTVGP